MTFHTEEDVKIKFLLPYLEGLGYKEEYCDFEKSIEIQEGRKVKNIFADVVIYSTKKKNVPLVLCETKAPTEILNRRAKEQAISYARLLPKIAPLVVVTNGSQIHVYETINKARLAVLPKRADLQKDLLSFLVSKDLQESLRAQAKHELFIIDDVQTFKNILKSCHNEIRNNEGYDPTVAFDEMSKILFCKMYEEKHSDTNRFDLNVFDDSLERLGVNVVKKIFEDTKTDERYSGLFSAASAINLQDRTTRKIVGLFHSYDLSLTGFDVKGEAFEYFLGDTFTGGLGEYFTPRNVVEFIVEAIDLKMGEKVVDPFCGTGGFLIFAFEILSEKIRLQEFSDEEKKRWQFELSSRSLYGTDWKERTSQACKMNMMVHGDGSAGTFMHHGLVDVKGEIEEDTFNICLTNPPFGSTENDPKILEKYELGSGRKSQSRLILAIERSLMLVKQGGWVGIVVIDGILNNDSMKYVRDYIRENAHIKGTISLAKETFQGYGARAKTSILLLQRKLDGETCESEDTTFMSIASNTGYAPNGDQIPGNELPDILLAYKAFLRGDSVPVSSANVWTAEIQDRLDAEFYSPTHQTEDSPTFDSVQSELEKLLSASSKGFKVIKESADEVIDSKDYETKRIGDMLSEVRKKESIQAGKTYKLLGVRWWGGGAFHREEKMGQDIKGKTLYQVQRGWIIYNRLFAFRGSFAYLDVDHEGAYVSNEFPTFDIEGGDDLLKRYIVHCLNSPKYLNLVDALSTGSTKTSRNRFNQRQFLDLNISVPTSEEGLKKAVDLLDRATKLRFGQDEILEKMKVLQESVGNLLPGPDNT